MITSTRKQNTLEVQNMSRVKFFKCRYCGNVIEKHHEGVGEIDCCGLEMDELIPNTVDASGEKHIPVVEVADGIVKVHVGAIDHPMAAEHWIEWVYLETDKGSQIKRLNPEDAPAVEFALGNEVPLVVYAYCNLHGLWKTEVK